MTIKNKEEALLKYSKCLSSILSGEEDDIESVTSYIFYTAYKAGYKDGKKDGKEEAVNIILGKMACTIDKYIRNGES